MKPSKTRRKTLAFAACVAAACVAAIAPVATQQTAGAVQAIDGTLQDARRLFEATDYEGAEAAIDRLLAVLGGMPVDASTRGHLAAAYELRGRSRFNIGKREAAAGDFRALLGLAPGYRLPADLSPRVLGLFDEIRNSTVGEVTLHVFPRDAAVTIDGAIVPSLGEPIGLLAGEHRIVVSRSAHQPAEQSVLVVPGSAQQVNITLQRTAASAAIVTIPPGVEVLLENSSRGVTEPGVAAPPPEWLTRFQVPPSAFSRPFQLGDLALGKYELRLRRPCFVPQRLLLEVDRLDDIHMAPIKMEPSEGTVQVNSGSGPATVFLDGAPQGATPMKLESVCEGERLVELRTPFGRAVKRLSLRAGEQAAVIGFPRPAFAIVTAFGAPQQRGGTDLRVEVERALAATSSVTLFAPPASDVQPFFREESLDDSWLSFDRFRNPLGTAGSISEAGRQTLSAKLARRLDAQGIASVTVVPGGSDNDVLVTLLAAGAAKPDVIPLRLDDVQSVAQAVATIDRNASLFQPSLGVLAVDVLDVAGVSIAAVEPGGASAKALQRGDIITRVDGHPIRFAAELNALVTSLQGDRRLTLEYRDKTDAIKRTQITASMVPRVLSTTDRTLIFNKHIVDLRHRLTAAKPEEEPIVRLNLGIALMGSASWAEARRELELVTLGEGPGIAAGTVQFLLGVCFEQLRLFPDAERAWRAAAASEALLSEDGPPVKDLAAEKLKAITGAR